VPIAISAARHACFYLLACCVEEHDRAGEEKSAAAHLSRKWLDYNVQFRFPEPMTLAHTSAPPAHRRRVCDDQERSQIWVVNDGTVLKYDGTFQDYKEELTEEIKKEVDA
jgi:hypothetical protein